MTTIDPEVLAILVCPESHQPLRQADDALVASVNERITSGSLKTVGGVAVEEAVEGGLVREDGRVFYAIRQGIPVLLVEEGLVLEG